MHEIKSTDSKCQFYDETYSLLLYEFDHNYYALKYTSVGGNETDLLDHYIRYGWRLGYDPSPDFCTSWYLEQNADVRQLSINPFYHYLKYGRQENRMPSEMTYKPVESELLFCCARVATDDAILKRIVELIKRGPDWSYIRRLAIKNNSLL